MTDLLLAYGARHLAQVLGGGALDAGREGLDLDVSLDHAAQDAELFVDGARVRRGDHLGLGQLPQVASEVVVEELAQAALQRLRPRLVTLGVGRALAQRHVAGALGRAVQAAGQRDERQGLAVAHRLE
jgi:hypothetical protein